MAFGLKIAGLSKREIEARIGEAARALQIEPLLDRIPKDLSGGQRQRVAIGHAQSSVSHSSSSSTSRSQI